MLPAQVMKKSGNVLLLVSPPSSQPRTACKQSICVPDP